MAKKIQDKITIKEVFFTILGWLMFILVNSCLIFILPIVMLVTLPFDRDKKIICYLVKISCQIFYFLNFVERNRIDKNGIKAPKKGERRIYVLNHASMFDVILMYMLPGAVKSVMKESYAKIPVIGWIAMLTGNIVLPGRSNSNKLGTYLKTMEKLERGNPVIIFPEGTKSKDSKIGKFYHGTFKLALDTKSDLVPVVMDTWNVIRPGGLWIRDVNITIKMLDIIKYEDIKDMDYKKISKNIRLLLMENLIKVREERRNKEKKYYRHVDKYIQADQEMKEELIRLKEKYKN